MTHNDIIKTKMTQLANIVSSAQDRINTQILSNAAKDLQENIGIDMYSSYTSNINNLLTEIIDGEEIIIPYNAIDSKSFDALSDDEKVMRNLIFAEAYFGLYYLSIALRKLVKGSVTTITERSSGNSVTGSSFDDLANNAELYRDQAMSCISYALGTLDGETFVDGTMGVFVV